MPAESTQRSAGWLSALTRLTADMRAREPGTLGIAAVATSAFGPAIVATAAVLHAARERARAPVDQVRPPAAGDLASALVNGSYVDAAIERVGTRGITVCGVTQPHTHFADTVRPLPQVFVGRPARRFPRKLRPTWADLSWHVGASGAAKDPRLGAPAGEYLHARVSINPVVCVTRSPHALNDQLAGLPRWIVGDLPISPEELADVGDLWKGGRSGWYRHPVLTWSGQGSPPPWWEHLADRPSLVVADGGAAWRAVVTSGLISQAPTILLVDRWSWSMSEFLADYGPRFREQMVDEWSDAGVDVLVCRLPADIASLAEVGDDEF